MRLMRLILINLVLTLLAPEIAEAMDMSSRAKFILVTRTMRIADPEAPSNSGDRRYFYSRARQPGQSTQGTTSSGQAG